MQEKPKRKVMGGYDRNGIPLWMIRDMTYYTHMDSCRHRVQRRLIRMLKVQSLQSDKLLSIDLSRLIHLTDLHMQIKNLKAEVARLQPGGT